MGINEELASATAERATTVLDMPEDLMKLYEHSIQKGVGAAELRARQCQGCQLTVNASELSVIAKASSDEVVRCEGVLAHPRAHGRVRSVSSVRFVIVEAYVAQREATRGRRRTGRGALERQPAR